MKSAQSGYEASSLKAMGRYGWGGRVGDSGEQCGMKGQGKSSGERAPAF